MPTGVCWPESGPRGVEAAEKCCPPCGNLTTGLLLGMPYAATGENAFSRDTLASEPRRLGATLPEYTLPPYMLVLRLE